MKQEIQINLGFTAKPFIEQLSCFGVVDVKACLNLDLILKSMCVLYMQGVITPAERNKADSRFMKKVQIVIDSVENNTLSKERG